eukprot:6476666-Amphidinium_carterae.2
MTWNSRTTDENRPFRLVGPESDGQAQLDFTTSLKKMKQANERVAVLLKGPVPRLLLSANPLADA